MHLAPDAWVDPEDLVQLGDRLKRLKMYPYFDAVHYILMCIAVREDLGASAVTFSRRHPFSCWLSSMLASFAGSFLSCFLLGEPVITPFKQHQDIILASVMWYIVFYSPFDIVYKFLKFSPVYVVFCLLKEVQRTSKISHGVAYAAKLYPESYLVQLLVGTSKGAASGIVKIVEKLVRGSWVPFQHELLSPTFTTKACVIASVIFTLERNSMYITAPHSLVYLGVFGFFAYFKLFALVLGVTDPFAPIENVCCALMMGGVWDAFSRALSVTREEVGSKQPKVDDLLEDKKRTSKLADKKNK